MPASGDRSTPVPPNNLNFLYQRHRSRLQGLDNLHLRPVPSSSYESGNKDPYGGGDRLQRIYPRELTRNKRQPSHAVTTQTPLLSALSSTTNNATQYTSDWARSLPFFPTTTTTQQPPHSSSPPAPPHSSGRDVPVMMPSSSPPALRPQSHPNQHPSFGGRQRPTQAQKDRRLSMYSQFGQSPYAAHVPLPHEDQPHFYAGGLPDLDSVVPNILPASGLSPGERGYFVGFDTLSTSGHGPSVSAENVLLVGEEGSLRTYKVSRKNVDIVGRLDGLRGSVVGAKILPWTFRSDPGFSGRPYVAVILHGPVNPDDEAAESSNTSEALSLEDNDNSPDPSTMRAAGAPTNIHDVVRQYQTTVEVYSLASRKYVATVFKSDPVDVDYGPMGEARPPAPIGDLKLDANGKFLVVASGASGEIYVFSPFVRGRKPDGLQSIRCIGKLWTSSQQRDRKSSSASSPGDTPRNSEEQEQHQRIPLFSLSHRWIAIVPPPADSLFSMKGNPLLASQNSRPPGLNTHVAPPKPTVNCGVDTPENESIMNKVSREVTQRVLKGTQWIGEQGLQAWNSYWSCPQAGVPSTGNAYIPEMSPHAFPPTHGHGQAPSASPTQVTIFDLQRLLDAEEMKVKNALVPVATFEPPSGCSHLSFAPSGLVLVTVSRKGDQQFVWSLMRMQYPRSGLTYDHQTPPYVRQIAKFTRMTVASVVDIVWNSPQGNRFSMLTERGTIHVHEIPPTAFQWPPLRRARRQKQPPKSNHDENDGSTSPRGPMYTAMDTINGTSAWLRQVSKRPRSLGSGGSFPVSLMMTPAATANAGGKVVKAGLSKGVSMVANSANTIYHASENKLHIGNLTNGISPGCMHWMSGRDRGYFAVVVTGTLSIYHVRQTSTPQKGKPPLIRAKISKRPTEYVLHKISDASFAPAFVAAMEMRYHGASKTGAADIGGYWHLRSPAATAANIPANTTATSKRHPRPRSNWHAIFETETNPPCQPFHTDRRIALCAYPEPDTAAPEPPGKDASIDDTDAYHSAHLTWHADTLAPWLQHTHHVHLPASASAHDSGPPPPETCTAAPATAAAAAWVFGDDIAADTVLAGGRGSSFTTTNTSSCSGNNSDDDDDGGDAAVENRIHVIEGVGGEQVVVTTVRRRGREVEEFFEHGCEVLDFADDRV